MVASSHRLVSAETVSQENQDAMGLILAWFNAIHRYCRPTHYKAFIHGTFVLQIAEGFIEHLSTDDIDS